MENHLDRMRKLEACLNELLRCVDTIDNSSDFTILSTAALLKIGSMVRRGNMALSAIAMYIGNESSMKHVLEQSSPLVERHYEYSLVKQEKTKESPTFEVTSFPRLIRGFRS